MDNHIKIKTQYMTISAVYDRNYVENVIWCQIRLCVVSDSSSPGCAAPALVAQAMLTQLIPAQQCCFRPWALAEIFVMGGGGTLRKTSPPPQREKTPHMEKSPPPP